MNVNNGSVEQMSTNSNVRKSVSNLAHDAVELGELQFKLIKADGIEAAKRARSSIAFVTVGLALLVASLPVALLAVAEVLIEIGEWSRLLALSASAGGALLLSLLFALAGWWHLKQSFATWERSSVEFNRNVQWLKSVLRGRNARVGSSV